MVHVRGGGGGEILFSPPGTSCPNIVAEQSHSRDELSRDELSLRTSSLELFASSSVLV